MARTAQVEQLAMHSVALNLAPLLAPHRKQGRLSLRIERMPQGTRLTRGTRNNDNTWSLASDELEDLAVQVPATAQKEFKIGVRVISLLNGSTLVTVDIPVRPGDEAAGAPMGASVAVGMSPAEAAELGVLRQELSAAKEKLAARDTELADRLAAAATDASTQFEQTLAKAETAWTEAENARLASIQQQWQEKFGEALAEFENAQTQAHETQVRELQEKIDALQAAFDQGSTALSQAKAADAAARERGNSAAQDALTKLAAIETKLTEREAELARAVAATGATKRDAEAALAKAEHAWRDGEAARLAAAENTWRETSAKALADAHAGAQALHAKGTQSEHDLLKQLAGLKAALTERDEALTRAQAAADQTRAATAQDSVAHLAAAEANWKAAEAARLSAVEAEWRTKLEDAARIVHAEPPVAAPLPANETELQELRDKFAALQAKLTLRDAASARAAKLAEEERRRWQKEAQDVIVKAARERRSDENARLATAQSEWSKQSVRELALVTARAEAAEAALTQLRIRATEEAPVQREIASLRSALAIREAELEHYRGTLPGEETAPVTDAAAETPAQNPRTKRMYRDALIAACIGIAAVILWPVISNMTATPPAPPPKPTVETAAAPAVVLPVAIATKDAKLRATPSIYGNIVGKLPRDTKVEAIETKGEWTRVRRTDSPAKGEPAEGWAKSSVLQDAPVVPEKPAKPKPKKKKL
ncbi:MAG: SH3 domain-containing protein [Micropepsaceae bacterium]